MEDVLERGDLILRRDVEEFEQNLARYVGSKYAVGVASGTDALILSLKVLRIGKGDEVLVPSYTFRATVEAVHHVGAKPVLYDLDRKVRHLRTDRTRAVIPAHIAGEVLFPYEAEGLIMIEDACQAIGAAAIRGKTACYSFYPAKLLGCFGDGGGIATNDKDLYEELLVMRNHYKGRWDKFGYNSRLDNLQAAVLNVKIRHLPAAIERRREIARYYDDTLEGVGRDRVRDVYQDYIITTPNPESLQSFLKERGVETMLNGYPFPEETPKGPLTLAYEAVSLRIPCNENISDEEVEYVADCINDYTS
jgi:dTDP-4-amino-4,6-dideoxygalactose transaminase